MLTKTSVGVAAGAAALGFIGYCVYFDHKRRSDPLFKQKLKERRRNAKESKKHADTSQIPDISDDAKKHEYFIHEVQLGEELLAKGDIKEGVEHLATAIIVCQDPSRLTQLFQQTLPPEVFQCILQAMPVASERLRQRNVSVGPSASATLGMMEEDLE